ncbi:zinc-dependent alcohol dehydrogenase [Streptomyces sp. NBC_01264]|uniref:zinc-dependent alcohol dehydrogenase n=1 Tax=Streptomyces sp. NBC_01264 TaxID=2903804 RepID=UPI0022562EE9|nr:zinc-binding dehydrogenase [Streptomyces sp. NBC_01264]MCX4784385.1 alcohol dehydrogenase catalytic domain-containing protein [Streptomyces sp. NBC_01264]
MSLPLPEPSPGGLLLEVTANGICGTDLHFLSSVPSAPLVLGHEIVGRIVAFGPGHEHRDADGEQLVEGDRIALFPWLPCRRCWGCQRFGPGATTCTNAFVYGIPPEAIGLPPLAGAIGDRCSPSLTGGFGRHVDVRPGTYMWRVPQEMADTVASLLDPLAVAVRTVDVTRTPTGAWDEVLTPDSTAVVLGLGAVGLLTCIVLRQAGVGTVVASGARQARLAAARAVGVDLVLDTSETDAAVRRDAVLDVTQGRGADLLVDATNSAAALREGLGMVRRLGTVVEVGNIISDGTTVLLDPARDVCQRNLRLLGVSFNPPRSYTEGMALLARGDLPFEALITRSRPFEEAMAALDDLSGDVVKIVLTGP